MNDLTNSLSVTYWRADARQFKKYEALLFSSLYSGSAHDYAILKSELPPEENIWFDEHHLHVDLGFLGICKDYPAQQISIPFKKSKNNPLTEDHKNINK